MNTVQRLLKELIANPEPGLAQAIQAVEQSEDPGQWEDLIWRMSQELGRAALEKQLEKVHEPPGVACPHCETDPAPPLPPTNAGLSPP